MGHMTLGTTLPEAARNGASVGVPNPLDSLVWALCDFTGHTFRAPPPDAQRVVPCTDDIRGEGAVVPWEGDAEGREIGVTPGGFAIIGRPGPY